MPVHPTGPAKHSRLALWKSPIPETPCMDPQLLPVQVIHLEHTMLSKEGVQMAPTPLACNQLSKPLLVSQQGACQGHISAALEIPPHHEAILQVREDKPVV